MRGLVVATRRPWRDRPGAGFAIRASDFHPYDGKRRLLTKNVCFGQGIVMLPRSMTAADPGRNVAQLAAIGS